MDNDLTEIINTVGEFIQNLIKRIDQLANEYAADGDAREERIIFFADDLNCLIEGLEVIKEKCNFIDIDEYKEKLLMIVKAWECGDKPLLIDVFEFELKPLLQYWSDKLKQEWGIVQ